MGGKRATFKINGRAVKKRAFSSQEDGTYEEFFPNKVIECRFQRLNGLKEGIETHYWDNGTIRSTRSWVGGNLHGEQKRFNDTGQLIEEEMRINNKLEGVCKAYYGDGTLRKVLFYKDGKEEGEQKLYDEHGQLQAVEKYVGGRQVGVQLKKERERIYSDVVLIRLNEQWAEHSWYEFIEKLNPLQLLIKDNIHIRNLSELRELIVQRNQLMQQIKEVDDRAFDLLAQSLSDEEKEEKKVSTINDL